MDDEKIIELFFKRSERAIRELDMKYGKVCYGLSYNILGDRQDAEECVNDAFFGVWNAIPPLKPNPLSAYLYKIVRNMSLKACEKKNAAKRRSNYMIAMEEIEPYIAAPNDVETEIGVKELTHIIEDFLETLSLENRVIFMRRYWFTDTCKEIGRRVGLTEKNVTVRLSRIRRSLKAYLIEREVFL